MSDIEKSFAYLHESIPGWFKQFADIEDKVVRMQEELAKVPVARSVPLKRKTGSLESLRGDFNVSGQGTSSRSPIPSTPAVTRKRKTPSAASGDASGPSRYRARHMIAVAYDGEIQSSLEQLVRAIGTGRNLLRKGKMAAKLDAMTALAGLHDDDEDDEDDGDVVMSQMGHSAMRDRAAGITDNASTPSQVFDSADKALEAAQNLCEKAAHQILREGDCRKNLQTVRTHAQEVQEIAKTEVARHAASRAQREQKEREAASSPIRIDTMTPSKPSAEPVTPPEPTNPLLQIHSLSPSNDGLHLPPKVMEIEVDDEEEEDDIEFVMPSLRFTSRAR